MDSLASNADERLQRELRNSAAMEVKQRASASRAGPSASQGASRGRGAGYGTDENLLDAIIEGGELNYNAGTAMPELMTVLKWGMR